MNEAEMASIERALERPGPSGTTSWVRYVGAQQLLAEVRRLWQRTRDLEDALRAYAEHGPHGLSINDAKGLLGTGFDASEALAQDGSSATP